MQWTDKFLVPLPFSCEELIPPGDNSWRNAQFVGQVDDLLFTPAAGNPRIVLGGNKFFGGEGIGLLFQEVRFALVVYEETLFVILEHVAGLMEE